MPKKNKQTVVSHININKLYSSGKLSKGSLVKFRFSKVGIIDYGLDSHDNEWCYGVISCIHWYVNTTFIAINPDRDGVCYDFTVHNITYGGDKEMINLELYDIILLST